MALRDIDGHRINDAAREVAEVAERARSLISELRTRGLAVKVLGVTFKINLGPGEPEP